MELIPFFKKEDENLDTVYVFRWKPESPQREHLAHVTEITIDELNDSIITKKECSCPGSSKFGRVCKHIKESINLLKTYGIELREK
jgi:hypothetical protein